MKPGLIMVVLAAACCSLVSLALFAEQGRDPNTFNRLLKPPSARNPPPPEDGIHDPEGFAVRAAALGVERGGADDPGSAVFEVYTHGGRRPTGIDGTKSMNTCRRNHSHFPWTSQSRKKKSHRNTRQASVSTIVPCGPYRMRPKRQSQGAEPLSRSAVT